MATAGKRGLLLVNLGTPDAPTPAAVRRYLREFLSDPRVVDLNPVGRWLLLNLIILPFRPSKSAHAYQQIWSEKGSPLLLHSRALEEKVREQLAGEYVVELAMRYGNPSIPDAIERLKKAGVSELTVLPLYPQEAASTYGSTLARLFEVVSGSWDVLPVNVLPPFHDDAQFLKAWGEVARPVLDEKQPDHVLYSFHGIPERHVLRSDASGAHCLKSESCCDAITDVNRHCYRAHCYATARAISAELGLARNDYSVSFQSRLGQARWLHPYTDEYLLELAKEHARIVVLCPAFVADCLETLEEIGLRGKERFLQAGGKEFTMVPCLNSHPAWVDAVVGLVRQARSRGRVTTSADN